MLEKSPFTFRDLFKQRKRWMQENNIHIIFEKDEINCLFIKQTRVEQHSFDIFYRGQKVNRKQIILRNHFVGPCTLL